MSDDRETMVPCPACSGGIETLERRERPDGSYYVRSRTCGVCYGGGIVTVQRMRAWRIAQHVDPSDR